MKGNGSWPFGNVYLYIQQATKNSYPVDSDCKVGKKKILKQIDVWNKKNVLILTKF